MSANLAGSPAVEISKKPWMSKPLSMPLDLAQHRLEVLTKAIALDDGKTENERNKHIEEKADLELKILELSIPNNDSVQSLADLQISEKQQPVQNSKPSVQQRTRPQMNNNSTSLASKKPVHGIQAKPQKPHYIKFESLTERESSISEIPSKNSLTQVAPSAASPALRYSSVNQRPGEKLPIRSPGPRGLKIPPSAASGGVPEPSAMYMSQCNVAPQVAIEPQHLLLVVDLNGTLLYRPNRNRPFQFIERPSSQQFLNYILAHFSVMIWSSARIENVDRICAKLFQGSMRQRLIATWGREHIGLTAQDANKRVQVYKRLERIWSDATIQARHPLAYKGQVWHQGNTVLIDDSVEKARSEPYNFVGVTEFRGGPENPNILRDLAEYLATLMMQTNVSSYIYQHLLKAPTSARSSASGQQLQGAIS